MERIRRIRRIRRKVRRAENKTQDKKGRGWLRK